jgi:excinuclease ABC subunit A
VCKGKRYNREALEITFRGKNIADVLDMTVDEALEFFSAFPKIRTKLQTVRDVGLGYIRLGQPATTLSGGEAQRVKLSTELSRRSTGRTLYILDEPTTGLAFEDTGALLRVLQRLVDGGNTVVVIEHHMDVIKNVDYVIDLGPLGGDRGGELVAQGTPEEIAKSKESHTARYLRRALAASANGRRGGVPVEAPHRKKAPEPEEPVASKSAPTRARRARPSPAPKTSSNGRRAASTKRASSNGKRTSAAKRARRR